MNREEKRARARDERRAERAAARTPSAAPPGDGPIRRDRTPPSQFMREVRSELRKVAWPSRREVLVYSATVLAVTTVLVLITFGMDFVIREAALRFF